MLHPRAAGGKVTGKSMIELGKKQELCIVKQVEFGIYLADTKNSEEPTPQERILLPGKEVPSGVTIGDKITVFVYRDSQDRLIATTREPRIYVGETAVLPVKEVGRIGAFLDWGLEKDLLLPFSEQTKGVKRGEEYLVALYVDKSGRLCSTMRVYPYLLTDSTYQKEDRVDGIVYEVSDNFGVFVAVNDKYSALIPKKEPADGLQPGQRIQARVTEVLEDGKLTLSLREKAYLQMEKDAEKIMEMIENAGGRLPFSDKATPELIRSKTGMSKNEFKRAIGSLYKQRLISIEPDCIKKI